MGASQEAGDLMKSLGGHKTMIVTDRFLHESGMAGQIQEILAQSGVESIVFPGAEPNPTDKNVEPVWLSTGTTGVTLSSLWAAVLPTTVPKASAWWLPTAAPSMTTKG